MVGITIYDTDKDPAGRKPGATVNGRLKNGRALYADIPPVFPTVDEAIAEALKAATAGDVAR
jgi:hypothetical protein